MGDGLATGKSDGGSDVDTGRKHRIAATVLAFEYHIARKQYSAGSLYADAGAEPHAYSSADGYGERCTL